MNLPPPSQTADREQRGTPQSPPPHGGQSAQALLPDTGDVPFSGAGESHGSFSMREGCVSRSLAYVACPKRLGSAIFRHHWLLATYGFRWRIGAVHLEGAAGNRQRPCFCCSTAAPASRRAVRQAAELPSVRSRSASLGPRVRGCRSASAAAVGPGRPLGGPAGCR